MTAICSPHLDQFCTAAAWRLEAQKNKLSRYSLGSALVDLTAIGAIYNFGADHAISHRLEREKQWFKSSLPALSEETAQQSKDVQILYSKLVYGIRALQADDRDSLRNTKLNRMAYLASLITYFVGSALDSFPTRLIGGCGAVASGACMIGRAAYDSAETYPVEQAVDLQNTAMQIKNAVRKA